MSMSDLLFPGNPERREKVIRKSQELLELMKGNFEATNELIDILWKHLALPFKKISLNTSATITENCDVLIERIHEIQAEVEKIDKKLKEELEPTLYEKLKNMNLPVSENNYKIISQVFRGFRCGLAVIGSIVVVGWVISSLATLAIIQAVCGVITTLSIGGVIIGGALLGIDLIVSAFIGSAERGRLEKAIEEYDRALEDFSEPSKKYQRSITRVIIRIEDIEQQ